MLDTLYEVRAEITRINRANGETVFNPAATQMLDALIAEREAVEPIVHGIEQPGGGWWAYTTPAGAPMLTGRPKITMAELEAIDAMPEPPEPDHDEDPDSDGYGWERAALRGIE